MLDHRPGQRHAVVGARAAADLVQDHQAPRRGRVQDPGRLDHLDHERALAAGQFVAGADAGEDPVGHADRRLLRRHEAADLGHQRDQCHLADVRALAGHVGTGDQAGSCPRRRRRPYRWARTSRRRSAHRAPDGGRRRSSAPARRPSSAGNSRAAGPARPAPPARRAAPARRPSLQSRAVAAATSSRSSQNKSYSSSCDFSSAESTFSSYSFSSGVM